MSKISDNFYEYKKEQQLSHIQKELKFFIDKKFYLFDYYRRNRTIKKPSVITIFCSLIIDFYWGTKASRISTIFIITFVSCIIINRFFVKYINDNNRWILLIIFMLYIMFLTIQLLIFLIPYFQKLIKNISNPAEYIYLAAEYNPDNHLTIIQNIIQNNSIEDIKREEQRFKIVIISQSRAKDIVNSVIPLVSFIYAALVLIIFGLPQNWGNSLEIATFAGFGIVPLITIVFSFILELLSENILIYQHCLFILQEALILAQERE